jgi:anti-sigma B factor antagonist
VVTERPHVVVAEHGDDVVVVSPVGDFDIDGADQLRSGLADALTPTRTKIVVDLSATKFLDSMALGTIIGGAKRAQSSGGWLRLVSPQPYVVRVLRVTGLDVAFGVFATVEDAIAHQDADPS